MSSTVVANHASVHDRQSSPSETENLGRAVRARPIRLLLADDHAMVREGLRLFLGLDADIEVLAEEAGTGQQAVELARQEHPDVILMDLLMPVLDGINATRTIHAELPDIAVIALTSVLDESQASSVVAAVQAGATGYLLKTSDADELRRAVHAAADGEVRFSPGAANRLVREVTAPVGDALLTSRESQVLLLLARGRANKEIARELRIGEQTVKTYVSNILAKLGVRSRTEAALRAFQGAMPRQANQHRAGIGRSAPRPAGCTLAGL